jgi:hypothetical protein
MRKNRLICLGFVALLLAAAMTVAFANRGTAASTNTCALVGGQPNCFKVMVAPIYVTTGQTGLATAKFSNTFGSATATHTVITLTLPPDTSAAAVDANATCSLSTQTVSCSFGNVASGATVKMTVKFTSAVPAPAAVQISGVLSYAEGNGTNGNDAFTATGSFLSVTGTDKGGYCSATTTKVLKNKLVPLLSTTGSSGQTATIESLAALAGGLCTPLGAAVEDVAASATCPNGQPHPCNTQVSIVAYPFPATGTVTLLFPRSELPANTDASNFVLYELSILDGQTWIALGRCSSPLVAGTDSCISSQTNVTNSGVKYVQDVLSVTGSPPDGHYGG